MSATMAAAQKGESGVVHQSRLQLVYATHQQLENDLETLHAYTAAAKKFQSKTDSNNSDDGDGGFSPWSGVTESAAKCIDDATRCLRLFHPTRTMTQFKGLTTVTQLYSANPKTRAPAQRVVDFLNGLTESFGGTLPLEVALSGGRSLARLDSAAASAFLRGVIEREVTAAVTPSATPPAEANTESSSAAADEEKSFSTRYGAALMLDKASASYRAQLRALLLLQIETSTQRETTNDNINSHTKKEKTSEGSDTERTSALSALNAAALAKLLSPAICAELRAYETICRREAAKAQEEAHNATLTSPTTASASPTTNSAGNNSNNTNDKKTVMSAGTSTSPLTRVGAAGGPVASPTAAGLTNWKWHALRLTLLILLAVLVRFASGPLARALKGLLQATHTTQARRRTLTL